MKKILIAFDGLNYSKDSTDFAIKMAKASNSLLVGVFLYDSRYAQLLHTQQWDVPFRHYYYDMSMMEKMDDRRINESIQQFTTQCGESGIYFKVHFDKGVPLKELLHESAFADIIVIDTQAGLFNLSNDSVNTFVKDLLVESSCPIMIVPKITKEIKNVFIAYDGSESSVVAMKMFSYLFPEWSELNTTILNVNRTSSNHLPKNRDIKDLSKQHFKNMKYKILNGETSEVLIDYLKKHDEQSIVVMGSYGRNALSRMLHSSLSNKVIDHAKIPVFITH